MTNDEDELPQYHELCAYTLSRRDAGFVHQFVVDCWALQHATIEVKPIGIVFPLVSLYLHLEHRYTGRQAQIAHMNLAKHRKQWPRIVPPDDQTPGLVAEIMAASADTERDAIIDRWCAAVWQNWKHAQGEIRALVHEELNVAPPS